MSFQRDFPTAPQKLKDSQPIIKENFNSSDTTFGIDHYAFSDLSGNEGKHNQVTMPSIVGGVHPATNPNEPKIYALSIGDTAADVLQFSRMGTSGGYNPVTNLHSQTTALSFPGSTTTTVFDFTGMKSCYGNVIFINDNAGASRIRLEALFHFTTGAPGTLFVTQFAAGGPAAGSPINSILQASGTKLQFKNNNTVALTNVFWSIQFFRILT